MSRKWITDPPRRRTGNVDLRKTNRRTVRFRRPFRCFVPLLGFGASGWR